MKNQHKNIRTVLTLVFIIAQLYTNAQQKPPAGKLTYELDAKQSKILWKAPKPKHFGFILFNSGSLSADAAGNPINGTFSINMTTMRNQDKKDPKENDEVDGLLRSDNYFAVTQYPFAIMDVISITPTSTPTQFKVSGNLTIKGYTNPIVFMATIKPVKTDLKINASLSIDRMKWHVTGKKENFIYGLRDNLQDAMIPDEIPITLDLLMHRK